MRDVATLAAFCASWPLFGAATAIGAAGSAAASLWIGRPGWAWRLALLSCVCGAATGFGAVAWLATAAREAAEGR